MISQRPASSSAETPTDIAVDHIGVVVRDLGREIAAWRALGFQVSDPVPLMGRDDKGRAVPLGQSSAHIVFANAYVELSSPVPGSGNHLERYLALGDGVRILVLAADDAGAARAAIAPRWPDVAAPRDATRAIEIAGRGDVARFAWFPLPFDVIPGVLSAVVQHLTPELVFHPSLVAHANGARRIDRFVVEGRAGELVLPRMPPPSTRHVPPLVCRDGAGAPHLGGIVVSAEDGMPERNFSLHFERP